MYKSNYFYRIFLPSIIAIAFFASVFFVYIIPNYRENLMNKKRETIRELTNTAWSVLHKFDMMIGDSLSKEQAQKEAAFIISDMKYGEDFKDYFWITDTTPNMIMHPYRPQMNGMNLANYSDAGGKKFFIEIVEIVKKEKHGFIDYKWQWKDDSLIVVPKLSYVKGYEPWGWIIGTGIYVEDVKKEISSLTQFIVWISLLILLIISLIIGYLARKNFKTEKQRKIAQEKLQKTMEKYKKLVDASTDGIIMTMNHEIIYCNPFLIKLLKFTEEDFDNSNPELIKILKTITENINKDSKNSSSANLTSEQKIKTKDNTFIDIIIYSSEFNIEDKEGNIYTIKDLSNINDTISEFELNLDKFNSIADLMNIGIFRCTIGRKSFFTEINSKAIELLGYQNSQEITEIPILDFFIDKEEKKEIVDIINKGIPVKDKLFKLKKADGSTFQTLVSLYPKIDNNGKTSHCDGIMLDAYDHICKTNFSSHDYNQNLSANILLKPISEFMKEAATCDINTKASIAAKLMTTKKSDIIIIYSEQKKPIGILTHGDISRRIIANNIQTDPDVSEIMSAPIISTNSNDMIVDAFNLMVQHQISYIVTYSHENNQAYYLSLLDLSIIRKNTPEFLLNSIEKASSTNEIAELTKLMPSLIKTIIENGSGSLSAGKFISKVSDIITERFIKESIQELGTPPASYVFLCLGSEGRKEQTLATDQDNAIVYINQNPENEEKTKQYFLKMGEIVCTKLDKVGYPFCVGGVMAMTQEWCLNINEIKTKISAWANEPNPKELLNSSIFFDFRPVYGEFSIANEVQNHCLKEFKNKSNFIFNLVVNTISIKLNQNLISGSSTKSGQEEYLDIKKPLLAITSIARLWSLKLGISERNTIERINALHNLEVFSDSLKYDFDQAFRYLMYLRLKNQLHYIDNHKEASNIINQSILTEIDKVMLKRIFNSIAAHQNVLATEFRIS